MNAKISVNTDFTLYDGRRHVLGACMLTNMFDVVQSASVSSTDEVLEVKSMKFVKKTGCNGKVIVVRDPEIFEEMPNAAARLSAKSGKAYINGWFVPDFVLPVQRRLSSEFEITNIVSDGNLSGSCEIFAQDPPARLRCVIEASKRLQLADRAFVDSFPSTPVTELLFLENIMLAQNYETSAASLQIKKMSERRSVGRIITLSRVTIIQEKTPDVNFDLAFSFHCER